MNVSLRVAFFRYANLYDMAVSAVGTYRAEVVAGSFPKPCNSTFMKPAESEKLSAICSSGVRAAIDIKALPSEGSTTDISASKTAKTCSAGLESSSDSNEADSREPYKVCVWGGGRMGQLFAWIMAGSISPPVNGDCAEWQRMQMRGTEVTICTSREDLIAACVRKRGMLTALQSAGAASSAVPSDPESGAKHSFMLTNEMVQGGCCASGAGEQRRVNVISRKAAESLGRVFDLVIIACNSGDTQPIGKLTHGSQIERVDLTAPSRNSGFLLSNIRINLHECIEDLDSPNACEFFPLMCLRQCKCSTAV